MRGLPLLSLSLCLVASLAQAQSTTTTTTSSSTTSNQAQAQAIQQQITAGIENGTLSATQIQELQAQELQLQAATAASANRLAGTAHVTPDATDLAAQRFSQAVRSTNAATNSGTRPNATGPDPFTYNTLGPDAYASQKYQNPEYNVPAYPTTNPVSNGVTQQYSGASAVVPYGAGYAQQPIPSGTGQNVYAPGVATGGTAATGQGVYVYRTGQGR